MILFRIPSLTHQLFPNIIWHFPDKLKQVFLSFDDGPDENFTPQILEILQREKVSASFFIPGERAKKSPSLVKSIQQNGNTIGIHSYEHQSLFFKPEKYIFEQLSKSKNIIEQIIDEPVKYFRPPFGRFSPAVNKVCRQLDLKIVMWNLMSYDFDLKVSDNFILNFMETKSYGGDTIVFHDGHKNSGRTVKILPLVIKILKDKGFKLTLIS